jgi:putative ABC transport system ATP-binding protein
MRERVVEIRSLERHATLSNERITILRCVTFDLKRGECLILKGVSGSGKTSLLHLIAGLDKPNSGSILIDGEPILKMPDEQLSTFRGLHIAMIFQNFYLIEHLNVKQNISVPLIPTTMSRHDMSQRILECMKLVNIEHKASVPVEKLSGGERQRVAIARAMVSDPDIILCDEPTANLDGGNSKIFIEILETLHQRHKSIIVATHDPLFDSLPFVDRVLTIEDGSIVE